LTKAHRFVLLGDSKRGKNSVRWPRRVLRALNGRKGPQKDSRTKVLRSSADERGFKNPGRREGKGQHDDLGITLGVIYAREKNQTPSNIQGQVARP